MRILLLFFFLIILINHSSGQNYYVSGSGNDHNKGTKSFPFKTIDRINQLHLYSGSNVYFKGGEIFKGTVKIDSGISGTKDKPIRIQSYGKGKAIIDSDTSSAFGIYKANYLVLSNLLLKGSGRKAGNHYNGINVINCNEVKMKGIDISGFQKSGVFVYASTHVQIDKVNSHDNGSAGITIEGTYLKRYSNYIIITNCRAENNPGDPTNLTNHSGNGIVVGNCIHVLIDHCTATNNGWDMPRIGNGPVGIWAYEADHVTIQYCLSYRNKTSAGGADGGGFDLDGGVTNSIVQYCVSYENQGGGYCIFQYWSASPWYHNIFRYNISENDGSVSDSQGGLYIWNSARDEKLFYDCKVYGNIIYNEKVAAISFSEISLNKDFHFTHNIFMSKDTLIHGKDILDKSEFSGNDWWSINDGFNIDGITSLSTWAYSSGKEIQNGKIIGLNIHPHFKAPGKLNITSASQIASMQNYNMPKNLALKKILGLLQLK